MPTSGTWSFKMVPTASMSVSGRMPSCTLFEGDDNQPPPVHRQISVEIGYEHRAGASLFGVEIGGAVRDDGVWFPRESAAIAGEIRLGHVW